MCAGPAAELGLTLSRPGRGAGRVGGAGGPVRPGRRPHGRRVGARRSPPTAMSSPSTTSTSPPTSSAPSWTPGSPSTRPPRRSGSPRTRSRCATRLTELGIPCPRWAAVTSAARGRRLRCAGRLAGDRQGTAWGLRRQGCRGRAIAGRCGGVAGGGAGARGGEGEIPAGTRRAARALPVRAGRGVAGRRDGAGGRDLHRGHRAGTRSRSAPRGAGDARRAADRR